jgi:hypothetical protein
MAVANTAMKALLDTNIIIHREAPSPGVNADVGTLFKWLDRLKYEKCIHPVTVKEISSHGDPRVVKAMEIKMGSYVQLQTSAPIADEVKLVADEFDTNANDAGDTALLNEVFASRVNILITEDRKIHEKARRLGLEAQVFNIERFLERAVAENPDQVDYKVLSVRRELFGNINLRDPFFDSFRQDYEGFDKWFNKKANDHAYVCKRDEDIGGFLFVKIEDKGSETYSDMVPPLSPAKRLKIGTLKVVLNGRRLGERFLKIVFDNARINKVEEIYVTIFDRSEEQKRLIDLLLVWGFKRHGIKRSGLGEELVFVRSFRKDDPAVDPKQHYPWLWKERKVYVVPIKPEFHTELLPDSILRTEDLSEHMDGEPHQNAISKVYVSHTMNRDLRPGDTLIFYRTGGMYKGVATTIGIVESVINPVPDFETLRFHSRKRSVLNVEQLHEFWERNPRNRPCVVNFLHAYSLKTRPNLKALLEAGIFPNMDIVRTINEVPFESLKKLLILAKL